MIKHYKGFDIKVVKEDEYKYQVWYGLRRVGNCKTIKHYKDYINLILWSRENIPQ